MTVIICYLIMTILLAVNLGFTICDSLMLDRQTRRVDRLERMLADEWEDEDD